MHISSLYVYLENQKPNMFWSWEKVMFSRPRQKQLQMIKTVMIKRKLKAVETKQQWHCDFPGNYIYICTYNHVCIYVYIHIKTTVRKKKAGLIWFELSPLHTCTYLYCLLNQNQCKRVAASTGT